MSAALTDHEIEMLRGFLKGADLNQPHLNSVQAEGLGIGTKQAAIASHKPHLDDMHAQRMVNFFVGMCQNITNDQAARQMGQQMSALLGLSYHASALLALATSPSTGDPKLRDDMQREIGAVKALVNDAVTQINASMESVQVVIDELRDERETLAISRALEADPEFGKYA